MCVHRLVAAVTVFLATGLLVAEEPPFRVVRGEGAVEIDNGLVKARFTTGNDGVKQEYLAARDTKWVLLAEGFRQRSREQAEVEVSSRSQRHKTKASSRRFTIWRANAGCGVCGVRHCRVMTPALRRPTGIGKLAEPTRPLQPV